MTRPLLMVDVDGVISLFGFDRLAPPPGRFLLVDGIPHYLSDVAGAQLRELAADYELTWCTGWEEKANDYLPLALGLPGPLTFLTIGDTSQLSSKLAAIGRSVEPTRPLAWVDDAHEEACARWAASRPGPTLLVTTDPAVGLTPEHVAQLRAWARSLS